jgi:hypothetical protein
VTSIENGVINKTSYKEGKREELGYIRAWLRSPSFNPMGKMGAFVSIFKLLLAIPCDVRAPGVVFGRESKVVFGVYLSVSAYPGSGTNGSLIDMEIRPKQKNLFVQSFT